MNTKDYYNTFAASFDGSRLVYYCYNQNITTIEEFIHLQQKAFMYEIKKQHRLFKKYETNKTDLELIVSLN